MNPYEGCQVKGPYFNNNLMRDFVWIFYPDGKREGTIYSRYKMEIKEGRRLTKNEIVHHLDGDPMNDNIENLQIVSRSEHNKIHNSPLCGDFICPRCYAGFELKGVKLSDAKRRKTLLGCGGPFCSKRCANLHQRYGPESRQEKQ